MPSKLFTSNTDKTAEGASSSGLAAVEKPTENNMCFRTSNRKASFGSLAVFVCSCMTLRPCGRFFPDRSWAYRERVRFRWHSSGGPFSSGSTLPFLVAFLERSGLCVDSNVI